MVESMSQLFDPQFHTVLTFSSNDLDYLRLLLDYIRIMLKDRALGFWRSLRFGL